MADMSIITVNIPRSKVAQRRTSSNQRKTSWQIRKQALKNIWMMLISGACLAFTTTKDKTPGFFEKCYRCLLDIIARTIVLSLFIGVLLLGFCFFILALTCICKFIPFAA